MKILIVSALFPPNIVGGAEISAFNNASYHRDQGHEIAVLTTAKDKSDELYGEMVNGMKIWRIWMPRLYSAMNARHQPVWKKAIYHLQDHFDPRNRKIARQIIDSFKPEYAYIHVLQGLGWNVLAEIARADVPATCFLHDLSLVCYRTTMYRGERECLKQCAVCGLSSRYKVAQMRKVKNLKFISPSKANLERAARFAPIKDYPNTNIFNPNTYPPATVPRQESETLRLLYVGRLDHLKGVDLLLSVADELAQEYKFTLTLVGSGKEETAYRALYENKKWCTFTGFLSHPEISNLMVNSDVLCMPSVWFEAMGGVMVHALGLGLPVIGSRKGGIVEVVEHQKNGLLVEPGNKGAWKQTIQSILDNPDQLKAWSQYAQENKDRFSAEANGKKISAFSLPAQTMCVKTKQLSDQ